MAGIEGLVRALREGDDAAKTAAARALCNLAYDVDGNHLPTPWDKRTVLIIIPPLVELLRGSADAIRWATWALIYLAEDDAANQVLIAEAGGIPPLVHLLRHGTAEAKAHAVWTLRNLAHNNDANAVTIAAAVGLEALVELARGGDVTVDYSWIVSDAGLPAKHKAALVVAALLGDCVPDSARDRVPDVLKAAIGSYL